MSSTPVLGKRKCAYVSYAELDANNFDDGFREEIALLDEGAVTDDDDDDSFTFGSRKVGMHYF